MRGSGCALVDVVQAAEHWPGSHPPLNRPTCRYRRLKAQGPMRPFQVVVLDELGEYRSEMLLIEDDQMVETFSAERAEESFDDRVRTRTGYGRSNGITTDASGPPAEVASVRRIMIMEQMARLVAPGRRSE